jgi:hypothetical protein
MNYKLTILNSAVYAYLIGCLIYSLWNYPTLSSHGGWGIVYMVGLFALGLTALIVDLVIQKIFKRRGPKNSK